jgi:para-nitrobenzyl esterase
MPARRESEDMIRSLATRPTQKLLRAFLAILGTLALVACEPAPQATTELGQLRGVVTDNVIAFKGIAYAAPPVGEWRWRPPQPADPWQGVRDASEYGAFCAQPQSDILWFDLGEVSEDCLTLNVWTPDTEPEKPLPVMIWIHGGGYSQGSGNIARLNSSAMAAQGVVLVTVNYRLHAFGFLAHPAIGAAHPDEPHGNYGLMDNVAALEWVQRNISNFGGDPGNVTLFGESAGAGIVNFLMVMPSTAGLFHRAISQSSSVGLALEADINKRVGFSLAGEKRASQFAKKLPMKEDEDVAVALRELSTDEILSAMAPTDRFTPVVDGEVVPDQVATLFAEGKQHDVPYMSGGVSWEASLGRQIGGGFSPKFAARLVPKFVQERHYPGLEGEALEDQIFGDLIVFGGSRNILNSMQQLNSPAYSYFMSYVASDRRDRQPGVAHADDIAFVMQTLEAERDLEKISGRDREISALMSAYWVQFARTGNPNAAGLPAWQPYTLQTPRVLEIGDEILLHESFRQGRIAYHVAQGNYMLARSTRQP